MNLNRIGDPCRYRDVGQPSDTPFRDGIVLSWSTDSRKFDGLYPVAVIEDIKTGFVCSIPVDYVSFGKKEPEFDDNVLDIVRDTSVRHRLSFLDSGAMELVENANKLCIEMNFEWLDVSHVVLAKFRGLPLAQKLISERTRPHRDAVGWRKFSDMMMAIIDTMEMANEKTATEMLLSIASTPPGRQTFLEIFS